MHHLRGSRAKGLIRTPIPPGQTCPLLSPHSNRLEPGGFVCARPTRVTRRKPSELLKPSRLPAQPGSTLPGALGKPKQLGVRPGSQHSFMRAATLSRRSEPPITIFNHKRACRSAPTNLENHQRSNFAGPEGNALHIASRVSALLGAGGALAPGAVIWSPGSTGLAGLNDSDAAKGDNLRRWSQRTNAHDATRPTD